MLKSQCWALVVFWCFILSKLSFFVCQSEISFVKHSSPFLIPWYEKITLSAQILSFIYFLIVTSLSTTQLTDFSWSLSNDLILSSSLDATARLWTVSSGTCARTVSDPQHAPLHACCFQPLNNNMVVVSFLLWPMTLDPWPQP